MYGIVALLYCIFETDKILYANYIGIWHKRKYKYQIIHAQIENDFNSNSHPKVFLQKYLLQFNHNKKQMKYSII